MKAQDFLNEELEFCDICMKEKRCLNLIKKNQLNNKDVEIYSICKECMRKL